MSARTSRQNPPRDPYREARQDSGVLKFDIHDQRFLTLLQQADIQAVPGTYRPLSSNAPFRIPIPAEEAVRAVRQLPIATDPPGHGQYRKLDMPVFTRPNDPVMAAAVRAMVEQTVAECIESGAAEIVNEFALPLQSRALTLLLNVPIEHAEEWISWGTRLLRNAERRTVARSQAVDAYIDRQLDRAMQSRGSDFFGLLVEAGRHGKRLSRDEMRGFANLALAGGRATIINLISNTLAWLAENPAELARLRNNRQLVSSATEEFVRYFSPLPHVGRAVTGDAGKPAAHATAASRVSPGLPPTGRVDVVDEPDTLKIDRRPNPPPGFDAGVHGCLGAPHARLVLRSILKVLSQRIERLTVLDRNPSPAQIDRVERLAGYERLLLTFKPL